MKPLRIILIVILALGVALLGAAFAVNWVKAATVYVNVWVQAEEPANDAFPKRIEFVRRGPCDVDGETLTYKFKGDTVTIGDTQYGVTYDLNHMTLSSASGSASYVSTGSAEQFDFRIEDGCAVITDYHGEQDILVIPSTLGGAPVIRVDSGLDHQNFTKIVFPEGMTEIESRALKGCYYLKEVDLPSTIREIGGNAFAFCTSLEKVIIPEGVTSISLNVFQGCERLSSVSLPASLIELNAYVFMDSPHISEVTIAAGNTAYKAQESAILSADGTTLVAYLSGDYKTSYTTPAGVTTIGKYAFSDCPSLQQVIVSEGVAKIENGAFRGCDQLESVSLPASLNDCALPFYDCNALIAVSVSQDNPKFQVRDGLLMSKDVTTLIEYLYGVTDGTLVLPEGIRSIEPYAFINHDDIDRIILPQSITNDVKSKFSIGEDSLEYTNIKIVAPKDSAVYAYAESRGLKVEASGD